MGVFDQAARYAARNVPLAVIPRLLLPVGGLLRFREWLDTRSLPLPGGPDRTADLIAALDDPAHPEQPWLLVLEFQAQHDPDKLDVTLEEAGILRGHARHGDDRRGKFKVLTALVYLLGRCPETVLDLTLSGGFGTRHAPLVWNVAEDDAAAVLDSVASGAASWGLLFWVPLMIGGSEEGVIRRWREVVAACVSNRRDRGNLAGIAMVFAELAGRVPVWRHGLEGFEMTESQVVNEWILQGEVRGTLARQRQNLLETLEVRFPGEVSVEIVQLINQQESLPLLSDWFRAALRASTFAQFLAGLKG